MGGEQERERGIERKQEAKRERKKKGMWVRWEWSLSDMRNQNKGGSFITEEK